MNFVIGRLATSECKDISNAEDVDPIYVSRVMKLNLLVPEIVQLFLDDRLECTDSFNDFCIDLPSTWADQYKHIKVTSFTLGGHQIEVYS